MRVRKFLAGLGVAAAALGLSFNLVNAQQPPQPIALVSIAPVERVLADTSYLLRACNVPEMGGLVNLMVNQYTQGIDTSKPIGATVTLQGQTPSAVIFMPMTDRNAFFGALAGMGIEPDDLGDGLFEIEAPGQTLFAKDTGSWMFVAQSEEALAAVPADPSTLLGKLPESYDIGVRLNVQALPAELKNMATQQMRIGFERGMAEQSGQTDEELAASREMGEASIKQLEQLIADTEQVFLGWSVNEKSQTAYFDVGAQFVSGSALAEQANAGANQTSDYTALMLPGASVKFRASSTISDNDKAVTKNNLKNSISQLEAQLDQSDDIPEEAKGVLKELIKGLAVISDKTIDEGIIDSAGSVSVADGTLRVLLGGQVADGNALAAEFKKAVAGFPDYPNVPTVEFDYETYNGFALHRATIPVKIADPGAKKVFGDSLNVIIGTADKSFLIGLDPTGDGLAKSAIDGLAATQGVKVSPFEAVVEFEQLLRFAQSVSPNSMLDNAIATMSDYAGKDKVTLNGRVIERGGVYRLAIEEGVMRSIGAAAKAGGGGGGF